MKQINIKFNGIESFAIKKSPEEAATQAANDIINAAVEKAVERAAKQTIDEPEEKAAKRELKQSESELKSKVNNEPERKTAVDPMQVLASINKATVSGAQLKPHNVITIVQESDKAEELGGRGITETFDSLVAQWNTIVSGNNSYDDKLELIRQIIVAAENIAKDYGTNTSDYQLWIDKANEWRCYRVTMIGNYSLQMFNNSMIQVQHGASLAEIMQEWGNEGWEHSIDYAYLGNGIVEDDFNNFEILGHWGGEVVGGVFVPNPNKEQRYIYDSAMIAIYRAKHAAIGVLLNSNEISDGTKEILRSTKTALEAQLQNLIKDRNNIAREKGYTNGNNVFVNEYSSTGNKPFGLIQGLFPPEESQTSNNIQEPPEYTAKCQEYRVLVQQGASVESKKQKVNEIINLIQGYISSTTDENKINYWQKQLQYWTGVLTELTGDNGNGGRKIDAVLQTATPINTDKITKEKTLKSKEAINSTEVINNPPQAVDVEHPVSAPIDMANASFNELVNYWGTFIENLTNDEPDAYQAKIDMLNTIINKAEEEGQNDDIINIWKCRRFIMIQNYACALLQDYNQQLNEGSIQYTDWPFKYVKLHINGQEFSIENTLFDTEPAISLTDFWHSSFAGNTGMNHMCGHEDCGAVLTFRGKLPAAGDDTHYMIGSYGNGLYNVNDDPQKEFFYSSAMIAYYRAQIQAIRAQLTKLEKMNLQPGDALYSQMQNYRGWINRAYSEIARHQRIINEYCAEYNDALTIPGLSPAEPAPPQPSDFIPTDEAGLLNLYNEHLNKYRAIYSDVNIPENVNITALQNTDFQSGMEDFYINLLDNNPTSDERHLLVLIIAAIRLGNQDAAEFWIAKYKALTQSGTGSDN